MSAGLLMLLGSMLILGNPEVSLDALSAQTSYATVQGRVSSGSETLRVNGMNGVGASLYGHYQDDRPVRHSLSYRQFEGSDYRSSLYTAGVDALWRLSSVPVELAIGAELGSTDLRPQGFSQIEAGPESMGGELHLEAIHYFTMGENVGFGFVRPALQSYRFNVEAGQESRSLSANAFSIALGVGARF